jgi:hypothetical protein
MDGKFCKFGKIPCLFSSVSSWRNLVSLIHAFIWLLLLIIQSSREQQLPDIRITLAFPRNVLTVDVGSSITNSGQFSFKSSILFIPVVGKSSIDTVHSSIYYYLFFHFDGHLLIHGILHRFVFIPLFLWFPLPSPRKSSALLETWKSVEFSSLFDCPWLWCLNPCQGRREMIPWLTRVGVLVMTLTSLGWSSLPTRVSQDRLGSKDQVSKTFELID